MSKSLIISVRLSTILLLTVLFCSNQALTAQEVIDPSVDDPNYDADKSSGALSGTAGILDLSSGSKSSAKPSQPVSLMPGSCFIERDASFVAVPRNDDGSLSLPLPFNFDLYGTTYNSTFINTNGNLSFGSSLSSFSSSGFPINTPIVAPFWADVDTNNPGGGQIFYQVNPTSLVVTWEGVGYYSSNIDKLNTFQVIISTLNDPITGVGNNVTFGYGDMQWTTGSASGGVNGFGGTPATVGINAGNGTDFIQIGRFNEEGDTYVGPNENDSGIDYLDDQCFSFNVSMTGNIPPSASNFPNGPITIDCGQSITENYTFIGPEPAQMITPVVNTNGACNTFTNASSGSTGMVSVMIMGGDCNVGTNTINISATDNGTPAETSDFILTIIVNDNCPVLVCQADITADADFDLLLCDETDGTITINASCTGCPTGSGDLRYAIMPDINNAEIQASNTFTNLSAGVYTVMITVDGDPMCSETLEINNKYASCGRFPWNGN